MKALPDREVTSLRAGTHDALKGAKGPDFILNQILRRLVRPAILTCALSHSLLAAETHPIAQCSDLLSTPDRIEIPNEYIAANAFTVDRSLNVSSRHFPFDTTTSLEEAILSLPAGSTWVDMGAGEGRLMVEGLEKNVGIDGVAIAYKRPATAVAPRKVAKRFRYLEGDYVENMARDGKLDQWMGKTALITDVFGPLSYSERLPLLLNIYFDLLEPNGTAYFNLMSERNFVRTERGVELLRKPTAVNPVKRGSRFDRAGVIEWLGTIPGIDIVEVVEMKVSKSASGEVWEKSIAVKVRKTHEYVNVPDTLETRYYEASNPPRRIFGLKKKPSTKEKRARGRPTRSET